MFNRFGQVLYPHMIVDKFGGGNIRPGFEWNQCATFEAGTLTPNPTGFDSVGGPGAANLSVTAAAAIRGNFGMNVNIPNTNARYGVFSEPNNETYVEVQMLLNFAGITFPSPDQFSFLLALGDAGESFFVEYRNNAGTPRFVITIRNNAGGVTQLGANYVGSINQSYQIRVRWQRAVNAGYLKLFVNGTLLSQITGIANETRDLDEIRIGATGGLDATTSGDFHVDNACWSNIRR